MKEHNESTIIITTAHALISTISKHTASPLKCVPTNLVILNEPFYLDSVGGETLATISTVVLFFYIMLSILLYHSRSCCQKRDTMQIFVTRTNKIHNFIYWLFLGVFEIVCIYGASMKQDENNPMPSMTFFNALLWTTTNSNALLFLLVAFCSKELYRLFMWAAVVLQWAFFSYLIVEKIARKAVDVDLLIPVSLFVLCLVHIMDVPHVFRITANAIAAEKNRIKEVKLTRSLPLPYENELLNKPANNLRDTDE